MHLSTRLRGLNLVADRTRLPMVGVSHITQSELSYALWRHHTCMPELLLQVLLLLLNNEMLLTPRRTMPARASQLRSGWHRYATSNSTHCVTMARSSARCTSVTRRCSCCGPHTGTTKVALKALRSRPLQHG